VKVSLRISPYAPLQEVIEFTRSCEAAGFDGVGFLDSAMINRDVFVTLGLAAANTSRLMLASAVTNPISRHVSTIASSAISIDDLAPGRLQIWIGRGFSAVNLAGLPAATTRQLRDSVRQLRRLLAGDWDVFEGTHSRMRMAPRRVPVYVAAAGPRTIRMAGEVADGLLLGAGLSFETFEKTRSLLDEGARSAGRDPKDVDFCINLLTAIRPTREEALHWAGPLIVLRLDDPQWLKDNGIDAKGIGMPKGSGGLYPDPMHAEDHEAAMDLAEQVPLELRAQIAEKLGLIGTPEDAIATLQKMASAGYHSVYMRSVDTVSFPVAEVEAYRDTIGPAVARM
jgi:5,10-methylenetetrahydromethanopterin reductase